MNRRLFIASVAGLALGNLLAGCSGKNQSTLRVLLLNGSIPPQILDEFRSFAKQLSSNTTLDFAPEPQLQTLFSLLQAWKKQGNQSTSSSGFPSWVPVLGKSASEIPDLVTLGSYWLEKAVQQKLVQPLDLNQLKNWNQLPPKWKELVTYDSPKPSDSKRSWGAPYRWGTTVIAYRQDIFKEQGLALPTDWSDLWRSDLRGRISLLDQPREVIGLILKKLGKSYNLSNLNSVPALEAELKSLQPQVKYYSSDSYLQPLLLGDTWVALGWSEDVVSVMKRSPTIAAVVPKSGTALWADLWVRPASGATTISPLVSEWINFCWRPNIASQLSVLSGATSPIILDDRENQPPSLRANPLLLPDEQILELSEFLQPLSPATVQQYQALWKTLRQFG
jgi:putative spermidine/putrescine transport system substrate-binding protein